MQCFREDAKSLGVDLKVLAVDLRPELSAAAQVADACFRVPRCTETSYISSLLETCKREHVNLVVPTIDTELPILAANLERFAAEGIRIAVSSPEVVAIARDKVQTAKAFNAAGVSVPRTANVDELLANPTDWRWPVLLKPAGGSSSVGIRVAHSIDEAKECAARRNDYVVQDLWTGREFTVNMFFNQFGQLRSVVPHWRIETRGGEVSKGRTEPNPVLLEAAEKIAAALPGARGALCFQAIVTESNDYVVFELNARFGGGYPIAHRAGAQFSKWLLEEAAGLPSTANNNWKAGVTMLRYDAAVFIDG